MRAVGVKSAAVPATVSEEPSPKTTGDFPGKAGEGDDPQARRPTVADIDPIAWRVPRARSLDLDFDDNLTVASSDASCDASGVLACDVTILVCSSCRDETGSDAHPRAGAQLAENTRLAANGDIAVHSVECLGNCKRRLSAALIRDGSWSYVFGDLNTSSGEDLVTGARLFATSTDGLVPWRGRPDSLKRGLVARIPPLALIKEDK